ncbi:MAG: hypothetical protein ACT4QA_15035 [Panacagrimonas sp.]
MKKTSVHSAFLPTMMLALGVASPLAVHSADVDILACAPKDKDAVTPTDLLSCQWKNGGFDATLAQVYSDGWRLIDTAFFEGDRQVIYLERTVVPAS